MMWCLEFRRLLCGSRRIWRGEIWKDGFGGAVADLGLLISGTRRPHGRTPVTRPPRHDPSHQLTEGGYGVLSLRHFRAGSLYPLIAWRVGAAESGAAKYGRMASAAPSPI